MQRLHILYIFSLLLLQPFAQAMDPETQAKQGTLEQLNKDFLRAIMWCDGDVLERCLNSGVDANQTDASDSGASALEIFVAAKDDKRVALLLEQPNINVNAQDKIGRTALKSAVLTRQFPMAITLITHGAIIQDNESETWSQLIGELDACNIMQKKLLRRLLTQHPHIIDERNCDGKTILMFAAAKGLRNTMKELEKFGADIEARDYDGLTIEEQFKEAR